MSIEESFRNFMIETLHLLHSSEVTSGKYENNFQQINELGRGGYGIVFKVIEMSTQNIFAIKKIDIRSEDESLRELRISSIIKDFKSDLIVKYYDVWYQIECADKIPKIFIQMEFCKKTLQQIIEEIHNNANLKSSNLLNPLGYYITSEIFIEILQAIDLLQKSRLIHRDLKPDNILLNDNERSKTFVKIADFGLATIHELGKLNTGGLGNLRYAAPEVLDSGDYGLKSDIYSLGKVLKDLYQLDIYSTYQDNDTLFPELLEKYRYLIKLYNKMTSNIPNNRPDCTQNLNDKHLWAFCRNDFINEYLDYSTQISHELLSENIFLYSMISCKLT